VLGRLADDAGKVLGLDVAVTVLVAQQECLADALALKAAQHLRELLVGEDMALALVANVELGPLALPVKRDVVGPLVELIEVAEVVILDRAGAGDIKEAEGNLVLGIGLVEDVLEGGPVGEGDLATALAVGNTEKDAVLVALDLVLHGGRGERTCQPVGESHAQLP